MSYTVKHCADRNLVRKGTELHLHHTVTQHRPCGGKQMPAQILQLFTASWTRVHVWITFPDCVMCFQKLVHVKHLKLKQSCWNSSKVQTSKCIKRFLWNSTFTSLHHQLHSLKLWLDVYYAMHSGTCSSLLFQSCNKHSPDFLSSVSRFTDTFYQINFVCW